MGKEECVSTLCEDRREEEGEHKRKRVIDKEREMRERETEEERGRKEWRKTILIGLCGHVEL